MLKTQRRPRRTLAALALAGAATLLTLLGSGTAKATTFYRLPLQYIPWPITAWMDHWQAPYAANANVRYDGTAIFPGSYYYYGTNPRHRGTDFGVIPNQPVYAAASGVVEHVYPPPGTALCAPNNGTTTVENCGGGFGNHVVIKHADGMRSIYAHLSSVNVVANQPITCVSGPGGTQIGLSGSSGDAQGAHLHFELRFGGYDPANTSVDPFGGSLSQPFDYWYQYALIPDPLHPGLQMHYPATNCSP